ncbi:hypothetical protein P3T35_008035 [Kitasatospora sp. GP30]|uniref:hypothetical protein n=1 Tax=Kitasatospora sp. GP30 TaxID=3035084 RepID=UPI000C6FD56C|nr:hypothetical protein [Kitasatospora sp. GP30]MDH6145973.1 hypothetical protein [Kitasatospora sp. GP30]
MSQHADVHPGDCTSCTALFTQLNQHTDPQSLTVAQLGELAQLGRRATFLHLAHLEARGLIGGDRRTVVEGTSLDRPAFKPHPAATALEWARSIKAPDLACGKLLCAYAAHGWRGQLADKELAAKCGVSVVTVKRHRPHLGEKGAGLIRFTRDQVNDARGRLRGPDRYALVTGLVTVKTPKLGKPAGDTAWFAAAAEVLLRDQFWFARRPDQATERWRADWRTGIRILAAAYEKHADTWTEADWRAHLRRNAPHHRPLFHLRQLIDTADPARPPVSGGAEYTATGTTAPLPLVTCERCEQRAFRPSEPGRTVCGPCREKDAAHELADELREVQAAHAAFERLLGTITNPLGKAV